MRNPPILTINDDDVAAEAGAAQARRHASEVVRSHLETHASLNPGASSDYVTWLATLHPENADVTIDTRFFVPNNPWWTIYEDVKYHGGGVVPLTATAVPVNDEEINNTSEQSPQGRPNSSSSPSGVGGAGYGTYKTNSALPFYLICSPLSLMTGFLVGIMAIFGTFLCEFLALLLCHYPAVLFYKTSKTCFSPTGPFTLLPFSILMLVYSCLVFADSLVLLTSVILVEAMAIVGYTVQLVTGGILMASFWHQYTRRSCHGIRIMFRKCSTSSEPSRHFIFSCYSSNDEEQDETINVQGLQDSVTDVTSTDVEAVAVVEHVTSSFKD
mmetsp:Transcript_16523/g.40250  ORF Transcript_16523/g.40250 Transcript_16523/m.40250 type:complete len:327 (+) Transcript_16523:169-1149(+)